MQKETARKGEVHRRTKETDIRLNLNLDGQGQASIDCGVAFMDHMLTLFTVHGRLDLQVLGKGDVEVDGHHTVEDLGICLGQALKQSLGDFSSIRRYGHSVIPMDEALARVTVDICNRPFLYYDVAVADQKVGSFDTALAKEFLRALALHAGLTLHVELLHGDNAHHILEAVFKGLGRALGQACAIDPNLRGPLSSKGVL